MIDATPARAEDPMTQPFRIETDSLGGVEVMSEALWGAQTQRSLQNFAISDERIPLEICLLYTSPSPRDLSTSRMPSSA